MTAFHPIEASVQPDQNAKIIEMIFLASDLAHSCEALAYDQRSVTKELVRCVNKSVSLLRRLLAENERETTEGVSALRARLFAISGGAE